MQSEFKAILFDVTLDTLEVDRKNVLMVVDRLATDIIGASAAGIKSVLVKTGEFKKSDLDGNVRPDYIFDSVNEIENFFCVLQTATSVWNTSDGELVTSELSLALT